MDENVLVCARPSLIVRSLLRSERGAAHGHVTRAGVAAAQLQRGKLPDEQAGIHRCPRCQHDLHRHEPAGIAWSVRLPICWLRGSD